jgi:hypothetical protein
MDSLIKVGRFPIRRGKPANALEPLRGIEPRPSEYKTEALPLDYSGIHLGPDAQQAGRRPMYASL